jgi:hypothetical protein
MSAPQWAASFNRQREGAPSLTTIAPSRYRSAAKTAACKSLNCFRVAGTALPAISASAISRAVMGAPARRITFTALLNSVPRLNHGLLLLRRFAAILATLKPRL